MSDVMRADRPIHESDGSITVGWTVMSQDAQALLMVGWRMRVEAEKRWPEEYAGASTRVWVPAASATFDIGLDGSVVLYEDEANAQNAAEATGGRVVPVTARPGSMPQ